MNIKIVSNLEKANCITHAGTFHADEIFATVILSKLITEIKLIRVQEFTDEMYSKINKDALVYDIGGKEYDHHQLGGNGKRKNGVKYAACGLIWEKFGREVLKKYNVQEIDFSFNYIDKNLIQFIDSNDNGDLPKLDVPYRNFHISHIISLFNLSWDEEIDSDEKFLKALDLAEIIFDEFMKDTISKIKAKDIVDNAIEKSENGIMILEKFLPWKEFIINSENEKAKAINFVVTPSKRGGYNVYAVPIEVGSFENRKSLPKKWCGLRDTDLQKVTNVSTARFCHNNGFICSTDDFEDAIMLAYMAQKAE